MEQEFGCVEQFLTDICYKPHARQIMIREMLLYQ